MGRTFSKIKGYGNKQPMGSKPPPIPPRLCNGCGQKFTPTVQNEGQEWCTRCLVEGRR